MPMSRMAIPTRTEAEVLFLSDHTCALCTTRYKDVQIHHIDGNPSNNASANLVVLCLDCHSRVTGRRGLGKAYSLGEIQRYKRHWEARVRAAREAHRATTARRERQLLTQMT